MAVSVHHSPTPLPSNLEPIFCALVLFLFAGVQLVTFFSLFVCYFYFYSNARKASRWKKSCVVHTFCHRVLWLKSMAARLSLPAGQQRGFCTGSCGKVDEDTGSVLLSLVDPRSTLLRVGIRLSCWQTAR